MIKLLLLIWIFSFSVLASDTNAITEATFRDTIRNFQITFAPEIKKKHKAELLVYGNWASDSINAYAERDMDAWIITIYGGMARHKKLSIDGLKLILCHELGHHMGGSPKKGTNRWSSAEGQADYYATSKCLRKWWKNESWTEKDIPGYLKDQCAHSFATEQEQLLCQRIGMAGKSVAEMFQEIHQEPIPDFHTPDPLQVTQTYPLHSSVQCRLDTFLQGALCPVSEEIDFNYTEEITGSCHTSLGDVRGVRPACWYATPINRL